MQLHIEISKWCHFMTLTHGWRYSGKKKRKKEKYKHVRKEKTLNFEIQDFKPG